MRTLFQNICRHREWLLPLIFIAAMLFAIRGVYWLTGRPPTDDPGELVSAAYRAIRLAFVVSAVGFTQGHLFGWRGEESDAGLLHHLLDSLCTLALLLLFSWLLWH